MKINKIQLVGANTVELPILDFESYGPFVLKSATGLGPPEVDVSIAPTIQEGGVYQGRRAQNRQIVLRVGLQPDWGVGQTPEQLRTMLYDMLTPKYGRYVKVKLMQKAVVVAQARGHVSRFEISVFSRDPEVQITIDCIDPYLTAEDIVYQTPATSIVGGQTAIDILNEGTAPAGFWMGITLQSAQASPLVISDDSVTVGESMTIKIDWNAGDSLLVDTRAGQRGVWKVLSGQQAHISMLNYLGSASTWLQLSGGNNRLLINNIGFTWRGDKFGHMPTYWGI